MRYRLRTLLIALALGPPIIAGLWGISPYLLAFTIASTISALFALATFIELRRKSVRLLGSLAMFRFTIRDLLWLMVVVALVCTVAMIANDRRILNDQLAGLRAVVGQYERSQAGFKHELRRITGKRVTGWTATYDPSEPSGYRYSFDYEDGENP